MKFYRQNMCKIYLSLKSLGNVEGGQIFFRSTGCSDEIAEMFGPAEEKVIRETEELRNVYPVLNVTWLTKW
jgi:hypothetical protein